MTSDAPVIVRVTQRFSVPPERVYDAWLDPELLGSWLFGPSVRDEEVVELSRLRLRHPSVGDGIVDRCDRRKRPVAHLLQP